MRFVPSQRLLRSVGLVLIPAWLALGMAGLALETLLLSGAALLGIALLDALSSLGRLGGIQVHLTPLLRTSKGKRICLQGTVVDPDRRPLKLRIGLSLPRSLECEQPEVALWLGAEGKPGRMEWSLLALERGRFTIELCHLETPSRLGLWDLRRTTACSCEVRVFPDLSRERHLLAPLFFRKAALGIHQLRQLGKGREFEQLRHYAPGDSYGDIYWKGTAKRRLPVTIMHQLERTQEIHVAIDLSRRSGRPLEGQDPKERFAATTQCERFIQAALALALAAEQQADRFGLITFSDQVHTSLPAGSGRAHYDACRDTLYTVEPRLVSPDYQELFIHIGNRLRSRSLLILLTDLGESWLSESFAEAVAQAARRHVILVHMIGSSQVQPLFSRHDQIAELEQLYPRLAGHLMWGELQETTQALKRSGVHLTASLQANLTAEAVSEYLKVKKRQLL